MEAPINHLNVIFVNPHFTDPHISELQALTAKVIELNPDVVYLNTNQTCGKWILEQLKVAHLNLTASVSCKDYFKCVLINKTRLAHEHTSSYSGSDFDAYQIVIKDIQTQKLNAVGLAVINEQSMTIDESVNGDIILKRHGLKKWFDLDKEIEHVLKTNVDSVPSCNTDDVLCANLKKLLPAEEETKTESRSKHHGISALIHKVIDKKEPVKELPPKNVVTTLDVNTIFCKMRMQHHASSAHVIDHGEQIHQMKFGDIPIVNRMPSIAHSTF